MLNSFFKRESTKHYCAILLLGVALAFLSWTGLRVLGAAIGVPGIVVAIVSLFFILKFIMHHRRIPLSVIFAVGVFVLLALVGTLNGYLTLGYTPVIFWHSVGAFALCWLLLFALLVLDDKQYSFLLEVIVAAIPVAFALAFIVNHVAGGGDRYFFLAANPNQLAMFLVGMPFLLGFMWARNKNIYKTCLYALFLIVVIAAARLSASNALYVAWFVALCCLAVFFIFVWLTGRNARIIFLLFCVVVLVLMTTFVVRYFSAVNAYFIGNDPGESTVRFYLWRHAITTIAQAHFLGFGPGGFLRTCHLNFGPFYTHPHHYVIPSCALNHQTTEAHNTLLGVTLQFGLLAGVLLLSLVVYMFSSFVKNKNWHGFFLLLPVVIFSLFHFILRHPIIVFYAVTSWRMGGMMLMAHRSKAK